MDKTKTKYYNINSKYLQLVLDDAHKTACKLPHARHQCDLQVKPAQNHNVHAETHTRACTQ